VSESFCTSIVIALKIVQHSEDQPPWNRILNSDGLVDFIKIRKLRFEDVEVILSWHYELPYDFYNPDPDISIHDYSRQILNPDLQFHGIWNGRGELIGFCSFGADGQVRGGDYRLSALDIGLGMKPVLTGKGFGKQFFTAILDFAAPRFSPVTVRLTVADFNKRALRLYCGLGFSVVDRFVHVDSETQFTILTRDMSK
jgi:ribosomal-protein-alanine N-acetyltransferase